MDDEALTNEYIHGHAPPDIPAFHCVLVSREQLKQAALTWLRYFDRSGTHVSLTIAKGLMEKLGIVPQWGDMPAQMMREVEAA